MCSGVRDPARYLKKNDLETPEAFDHDFNFISGIERSMEGATRISENMLPTSSIQGTSKNQKKGVVPLQNALKRNNVLVLRAPTGMTRQKQNQTAWNYK